MRKLFCALLAIIAALTFSGCADTASPESSPIVLLRVRENYAWGRHQDITLIDSGGNCYSQGSHSNTGDKDPDWVDFYEDGWYERLLEIAESGEVSEALPVRRASLIRQNAPNFAEWSALPVKEYGEQSIDYGADTLYGVYFDSDGEPRLTELAEAGDVPSCKKSAKVRKFVNRTRLLNFKFT